MFLFLLKKEQILDNEDFLCAHGSLYEEFKQDYMCKYTKPLQFARVWISICVLVTADYDVQFQSLGFMIINSIFIVWDFISFPYKDHMQNVNQLCGDSFLFIANVAMMKLISVTSTLNDYSAYGYLAFSVCFLSFIAQMAISLLNPIRSIYQKILESNILSLDDVPTTKEVPQANSMEQPQSEIKKI